jgi:DNA-directed RNA polymerase specialized sigma24 family protein
MVVDSRTIAGAKELRPGDVTRVLCGQATQVYRIAYALSGRWDSGKAIARFVLNRSVLVMPKWDVEADPANWFHRFTVQTSRRYEPTQEASAKDVLIEQAQNPDAPYIAFVAALRQLPPQQREAFLLRHGEKLNERYTALAMDCSTHAAHTHLHAAEEAMRLIAGPPYDALVQRLVDAYVHLTPDEDALTPTVNNVVFRRVRLRRFIRRVVTLILLAAIGLLLWGAWEFYRRLEG